MAGLGVGGESVGSAIPQRVPPPPPPPPPKIKIPHPALPLSGRLPSGPPYALAPHEACAPAGGAGTVLAGLAGQTGHPPCVLGQRALLGRYRPG